MNMRWIAVTVLGIAAFASWALWPGATFELERTRQPLPVMPAAEVQSEAQREALRAASQIMALNQVDRLAARAVEARASGRAFDMASVEPSSRSFDPSDPEAVDQRARRQLDAWGLEAPRVAVGAYLAGAEGWPDGIGRPGGFGGVRAVVDGRTLDGQPFCIQVGRLAVGSEREGWVDWAPLIDDGTGPGSFGACWLHARYGEPGPTVSEWMRNVGAAAALVSAPRPWPLWEMSPVEQRQFAALGVRQTAGLWGSRSAALADRCISGDAEACRASFVEPPRDEIRAQPSAAGLEEVLPRSFYPIGISQRFLPSDWLHELESQYGPERMAAFWTSDAPDVVTAFESAFGVDLETTMMELGRERFGHIPPGPRVAGWGWLGLLASLALGLGLAGRAVSRRVVA